jgi:hypothetical protein
MTVPEFKSATPIECCSESKEKEDNEKSQELAKLIPGGTRTAEMLLTAFKHEHC